MQEVSQKKRAAIPPKVVQMDVFLVFPVVEIVLNVMLATIVIIGHVSNAPVARLLLDQL